MSQRSVLISQPVTYNGILDLSSLLQGAIPGVTPEVAAGTVNVGDTVTAGQRVAVSPTDEILIPDGAGKWKAATGGSSVAEVAPGVVALGAVVPAGSSIGHTVDGRLAVPDGSNRWQYASGDIAAGFVTVGDLVPSGLRFGLTAANEIVVPDGSNRWQLAVDAETNEVAAGVSVVGAAVPAGALVGVTATGQIVLPDGSNLWELSTGSEVAAGISVVGAVVPAGALMGVTAAGQVVIPDGTNRWKLATDISEIAAGVSVVGAPVPAGAQIGMSADDELLIPDGANLWKLAVAEAVTEVVAAVTAVDVGTAAPAGAVLGVDETTGVVYYVDDAGLWQAYGSVTSFLGLSDSFSDYAGLALQILRVDAAENVVEAVALASGIVAHDDSVSLLPGSPTTSKAAIEALSALVKALPDQVEYADVAAALLDVGNQPDDTIAHIVDGSGDTAVTAGWVKYQKIAGAWQYFLSQEDTADIVAVTDVEAADRAGAITGTWTAKQVHDQIPVKRLDPAETVPAGEYRISDNGLLVQALTLNSPGNNPDVMGMGERNSWRYFGGLTLWGNARDYDLHESVVHDGTIWLKQLAALPAHRGVAPGTDRTIWLEAGDHLTDHEWVDVAVNGMTLSYGKRYKVAADLVVLPTGPPTANEPGWIEVWSAKSLESGSPVTLVGNTLSPVDGVTVLPGAELPPANRAMLDYNAAAAAFNASVNLRAFVSLDDSHAGATLRGSNEYAVRNETGTATTYKLAAQAQGYLSVRMLSGATGDIVVEQDDMGAAAQLVLEDGAAVTSFTIPQRYSAQAVRIESDGVSWFVYRPWILEKVNNDLPQWQPDTLYPEGQAVVATSLVDGVAYVWQAAASPDHTSGPAVQGFDAAQEANWTKIGAAPESTVPILEGIEMTFQGYASSWRLATNVVFVDAAGLDYSSFDFQVIADSDGGTPGDLVQGYNFTPLAVNGTRVVKVQYVGQAQRRGLSAIRATFRDSAASTGMPLVKVSYLDGSNDTIATGAAQTGAVTMPTLVDAAPADFLTQAQPIADAGKEWEPGVSVTTSDSVTMRIPAGTTAAFADGTVPTDGDVVIVIPDPAGTLPFTTEAQVDDTEIVKWQYVGVAPITPPDDKWLKIDTTGGGNKFLPAWGRDYTATGDGTATVQPPEPGGVNEDAAIRLYNDTPATVTVRTGETVRPFGAAADDPDGDIDVPSGSTLVLVSYGTYLRYLVGGGGSPATLAKNVTEFISADTTLEFYQDDPAGAADGKLYIATAVLNPTLPTVVGNNGRRIGISADWAAWLAAPPPTWTTGGTETMPLDRFPETGHDIVWLVADEAATTGANWAVLAIGDITINHVVPTFNNDADAVAGTVPGSLFNGSGTGDLADALYRVKANGTRVQGTF